jgi:NADH dehydrogenase
MTNTAVQEVEKREITFRDGRKLPYELIIWTAGIKPSCFCEQLDLPKQKGWLKVDPYLRIEGMQRAFAVGDAACFEAHGLRSGQNVEEAEAQGTFAARNTLRILRGARLRAYKPKNTVQNPRAIISLGGNKAVVYSKWFMFTTLAYRIKKFIERRYMKRFT